MKITVSELWDEAITVHPAKIEFYDTNGDEKTITTRSEMDNFMRDISNEDVTWFEIFVSKNAGFILRLSI